MRHAGEAVLHASCIAAAGHAALITGPAGAGKSALALQLMSLGAELVADDRTRVEAGAGGLTASAPSAIRGRIEARGVGLLRARAGPPAPVALIVDLARAEEDRLPPFRRRELLGVSVDLLYRAPGAHFPAAILQYLAAGRSD